MTDHTTWTHNRSLQRQVFPDNRLHWYWWPKSKKQNTTYILKHKTKKKQLTTRHL